VIYYECWKSVYDSNTFLASFMFMRYLQFMKKLDKLFPQVSENLRHIVTRC